MATFNLPQDPATKGRESQSAFGYLRRQSWTNPILADDDYILASVADNQTHTTFSHQPDFARRLTSVLSGAGTEVIVVNGTNIRGEAISESFISNGGTPVVGNKAFKTITSVVFPDTAGGRTLKLGIGDQLGLDRCMSGNEVIMATAAGVKEATLPTVTFDADEVEKNTVDFDTALDGAVDFAVVFVTTERTNKAGTSA